MVVELMLLLMVPTLVPMLEVVFGAGVIVALKVVEVPLAELVMVAETMLDDVELIEIENPVEAVADELIALEVVEFKKPEVELDELKMLLVVAFAEFVMLPDTELEVELILLEVVEFRKTEPELELELIDELVVPLAELETEPDTELEVELRVDVMFADGVMLPETELEVELTDELRVLLAEGVIEPDTEPEEEVERIVEVVVLLAELVMLAEADVLLEERLAEVDDIVDDRVLVLMVQLVSNLAPQTFALLTLAPTDFFQ